MEKNNIINYFLNIITIIFLINKVNATTDCSLISFSHQDGPKCLKYCKENNDITCVQWRCNNLKEMLINLVFKPEFEIEKNNILNSQDCNIQINLQNNLPNNNIITVEANEIKEINLGSKLNSGIINESVCALSKLTKLDISNNNLKGNNIVYGQLPGCINELNNLEVLNISNNKFRGRIPVINSEIKECNILNNDLCLFHDDVIPKVCLNYNENNPIIIEGNVAKSKNDNIVYFKLCENIFVDRSQNETSRIFNDRKNTNTSLRILIFSGSFPLCSLIITTIITIFGRIKSKFNKRDPNLTTFSASISHLPNNLGNVSNRHSLLTKYDSYNRPAPRADNDNSFSTLDQKRISSNPSTSLANTSLSSNTPSSPVISPNEIKNSNYRVIGSHYSLNMNNAQAIRFKNSLSMLQNNRNSLTTSIPDTNANMTSSINITNEKAVITNINTMSTPAISQNENQNTISSPTMSNIDNKDKRNSTSSKAKESLDLLLSSPQAMYYQSNRKMSPSLSKQTMQSPLSPLSPTQSSKVYSSMNGRSSPNLYTKGININKPQALKNPIGYSSTKISTSPTIPAQQYIPSQNGKMVSSSNLKMVSPMNNQSPNSIKRPRVRRVIYSFIADLPDELQLTPGEEVIIHKVFDDGYAYGENASNGQLGVFPITSLHPDDQDISPEEMESSPSLNDIQLSQLNNNKSPTLVSPSSPSKYNNVKVQDFAPKLMINKENISNNMPTESYTRPMNMNNLYPLGMGQNNNSQNSNSQNSNSQNSLTDEDDIDSLRRQSKIGYSAYMDQQKQKLMKKQAKQQARKNKLNSINSINDNSYYRNEQNSYKEPLSPTAYMSHNMILNENINNRMFGEPQALHYSKPQFSPHSVSDITSSSPTSQFSPKYKHMSLLNGIKSESPSSLEMQRMEDRRYKQIRLLNERLSKEDIGPEEKRYYLQLLQQLTS